MFLSRDERFEENGKYNDRVERLWPIFVYIVLCVHTLALLVIIGNEIYRGSFHWKFLLLAIILFAVVEFLSLTLGCLDTAAAFSAQSTIGKIIGYPVGLVLFLLVLSGAYVLLGLFLPITFVFWVYAMVTE
jgi:hypothetical protein